MSKDLAISTLVAANKKDFTRGYRHGCVAKSTKIIGNQIPATALSIVEFATRQIPIGLSWILPCPVCAPRQNRPSGHVHSRRGYAERLDRPLGMVWSGWV
jgi:hypothetical protein